MDYVNPQALAATGWLADNLEAPGVRVVDATWFLPTMDRDGKAEYAARHIPGALFFDIDDIADDGTELPHMLPSADKFSERVGDLGIGDGERVVVYDANGGFMAAARVWWMFRLFGHDNVAVLDGGLPKWLAEGRPTTAETETPPRQTFRARRNVGLVRDAGQLLANIESGLEQVVDVRGRARYLGEAPEPRPAAKAGHIPGSLNLPFDGLLDGERNFVMRPAADIAGIAAEAGLDLGRPVVASCGSGVTTGVLALSLFLLGKEDVAVYDGSWAEWGNREDTPVET